MNRQNTKNNIRPVGGADRSRNTIQSQKQNSRRPAPTANTQNVKRPPQDSGWVMPERPPVTQSQSAGYTQMPLRPLTAMPRRDAREVAKQGYRTFANTQEFQIQRPANPTARQMQRDTRTAHPRPAAPARPTAPRSRPATPPPYPGTAPGTGAPVNRNGQAVRARAGNPPRTQPARRPAPQPPQRPVQKNAQRPDTIQKRRPPRRPESQNREWVIPEGSAVYTSQGKMYEQRGPRPEEKRTRIQKGPNQPHRRNLKPYDQRQIPKKKKKNFDKEKFFLHIRTFFVRLAVMLLVVSILGLWWYRKEFHSVPKARSGEVTYSFMDTDSYTSPCKTSYFGDVLYVDLTRVSEWFGMVSVGSVSCMRFICPNGEAQTSAGNGDEEYAIFTDDSTTVLINGTIVILEAECRTQGSHIWIPLSFIENYVDGVQCTRSPKGTEVTFSVEGAEDSDAEDIEIDVSFKVKAQNALPHIEYPA